MERIKLQAQTRTIVGKKVSNLRKQNLLPAILYGHDQKPENLTINLGEFMKIYDRAGSSSLVDLFINEKDAGKILIHDVQYHPVQDNPLHVDLYKIKMTEKIETEIPLEFIGEAPAVKDLEGNLIKNRDRIKVRCLPADLVPKITVDISSLKTFDDAIHVKNLPISSTIEVLDAQEETVVLVEPPRSEEELKTMEEETTAEAEKAGIEKMETEVEAEKAKKEEGGEGAEAETEGKSTEKTAGVGRATGTEKSAE